MDQRRKARCALNSAGMSRVRRKRSRHSDLGLWGNRMTRTLILVKYQRNVLQRVNMIARFKPDEFGESLETDNAEPSRAYSRKARGAEGVTSRACRKNNRPTSLRMQQCIRRALSYAVTHRSADKELRDNTTDQTLAVAPQDVISAASFDVKQAACAVTISGLEQIQNS